MGWYFRLSLGGHFFCWYWKISSGLSHVLVVSWQFCWELDDPGWILLRVWWLAAGFVWGAVGKWTMFLIIQQASPGFLPWTFQSFQEQQEKARPWFTNTFQVPACVIFGVAPLAKESHVADSDSKGEEADLSLDGRSGDLHCHITLV